MPRVRLGVSDRPSTVTIASLRRHLPRLSATAVDGLLFAGSAVFAYVLWATSDLSPHRDWGRDAVVGYVVCAMAAWALCVLRPTKAFAARVALTAVCFVLVALVPMVLMVRARAQAAREVHVLPEVGVIERAGHHLAAGGDPYVAQLVGSRLIGRVPGVPRYEAFFPYFPLMLAFGLPSTVHWLGELGDGRLWMALVTLGPPRWGAVARTRAAEPHAARRAGLRRPADRRAVPGRRWRRPARPRALAPRDRRGRPAPGGRRRRRLRPRDGDEADRVADRPR